MEGSITGSPFKPWVKEQVDIRQKVLGKYSNIPSSDLQSYTNKTPFLRLASSVNLTNNGPDFSGSPTQNDNSVLKKLAASTGIPEAELIGPELAKKFILQGGVVSIDNSNTFSGLQKGLNDGSSLFNGSYGWGGNQERGYVPLPGITDASVTYYNNGSLSKTDITVKLYSKTQFSLFDVLYLRPGYTLLMEFGWSTYLDKDGNLQSMDNFLSQPLSQFLNPTKNITTQYHIYDLIQKEKETYHGNYEAVYGKISKFSWVFNSDGTYDCKIQLTAMGDVIESLKVNITNPNLTGLINPSNNTDEDQTVQPPLIANANKTIINQELWSIYQNSISQKLQGFSGYIVPDFRSTEDNGTPIPPKTLEFPNGIFTISDNVTTNNSDTKSSQVYIKYGAFLAFIQSKVLLYNSNQCDTPLFQFEMNFEDLDKDENIILKIPGGFSANPLICLIPWTNTVIPKDGLKFPTSELNKLLQGTSWEYSQYLGRLSQILVNIDFIANTLDSLIKTSPDGDINLLSFLQQINKGIIQSLGGINGFEVRIKDTDGSKIKFYEDIPQRNPNIPQTREYTRFNVYGVKPGVEGSFIRNVGLTADLSNELGAMISIAAQSNSNQISSNATAFSSYSAGLEDRIIEDKHSSTSNKINKEEDTENVEVTIESNFTKNINQPENSLFLSIYESPYQWDDENIKSLTSHNKTHSSLILGELTKIQPEGSQLQAPMFLPFNLSLEMDGLSGMRLYEKFLITDDILPPSYEKDGVDIQIKGINHSINPGGWTTTLDTQSVPADKLASVIRPAQLLSEVTTQTTSNAPEIFTEPPPPIEPESITRREAMLSSYNGVFGRDGEKSGMCSRWTYNMAVNYIEYLRGRNLKPGQPLNSGGNANQNTQYFNNLIKIGYTSTKVGSNVNRAKVINTLTTQTFGYGDVVVYYANDGVGTPRQYGHTQIYVGDINSSGWSTSTRTNYGTNMVYKTRTNNQWDLYIFRAPSN